MATVITSEGEAYWKERALRAEYMVANAWRRGVGLTDGTTSFKGYSAVGICINGSNKPTYAGGVWRDMTTADCPVPWPEGLHFPGEKR